MRDFFIHITFPRWSQSRWTTLRQFRIVRPEKYAKRRRENRNSRAGQLRNGLIAKPAISHAKHRCLLWESHEWRRWHVEIPPDDTSDAVDVVKLVSQTQWILFYVFLSSKIWNFNGFFFEMFIATMIGLILIFLEKSSIIIIAMV